MIKHSIYPAIIFAAVFLLAFGCGKDDNPLDHKENEHADAVGCVIKQDDIELARAEKGTVVGSFQLLENVQTPLLNFYLITDDGDLFRPEGEAFSFAWESKRPDIADAIQLQSDGDWNFHLKGFSSGSTTIKFKVLHEGHDDFVSLDIPTTVAAGSGGGL